MACSTQSEPICPLQVDYMIDHKGELLINFLGLMDIFNGFF